MSVKTTVISLAVAGLAVAGLKEAFELTQEQVFYHCEGEHGVVEIMEPNRYTLGERDIHITQETPDGTLVEYDYSEGNYNAFGLMDAALGLCADGNTEGLVERESQLALAN